jgi:hypothetical protein
MDEACVLLDRLDRIDRLRRAGAPPAHQLAELRLLLSEAERWSRMEGGDAGERAVARLRSALECDAVSSDGQFSRALVA